MITIMSCGGPTGQSVCLSRGVGVGVVIHRCAPQAAATRVTNRSAPAAISLPVSAAAWLRRLLNCRAMRLLWDDVVDLMIGFHGLLEGLVNSDYFSAEQIL